MFEQVSKSKNYDLSRSVESEIATSESIWALWTDVNNWPAWDHGLQECTLEGEVKVGQTFKLTPKNGIQFTTEITELKENERFCDLTKTPFGKIVGSHIVEQTKNGIKVTHVIHAEVSGEKVDFFEKNLLPKWENGLLNTVQNIVHMAEQMCKGLELS